MRAAKLLHGLWQRTELASSQAHEARHNLNARSLTSKRSQRLKHARVPTDNDSRPLEHSPYHKPCQPCGLLKVRRQIARAEGNDCPSSVQQTGGRADKRTQPTHTTVS